ncbi:hypothetical protein NDU88_000136 [Pleurodeles waltl]|uniref:Uncharacterized protein n=1 Tax=Pleurodeles waltl TaxID=8319 RepID=A0AAV7R4Z5_PLEWA|nr:hypothetical protein NDU88_000136 [Pleurodeles waltl]
MRSGGKPTARDQICKECEGVPHAGKQHRRKPQNAKNVPRKLNTTKITTNAAKAHSTRQSPIPREDEKGHLHFTCASGNVEWEQEHLLRDFSRPGYREVFSSDGETSQHERPRSHTRAHTHVHIRARSFLLAPVFNTTGEYGYSSSQAQDAYDTDSDQSSSKHSSDSDSEEDLGDLPGPSKRKKTEKAKAPPTKTPRVLTFSPEEIIHPRSSSWTSPPEVADYLQNHIRTSFNKDVRALVQI